MEGQTQTRFHRWMQWTLSVFVLLALLLTLAPSINLIGSRINKTSGWKNLLIFHLSFHLFVLFNYFILLYSNPKKKLPFGLSLSSAAYSLTVFITSFCLHFRRDFVYLANTLLVFLTIFTFALMLPQILDPKHYRFLFKSFLWIFSVSALLTFTLETLPESMVQSLRFPFNEIVAQNLYANPNAIGSFLEFFPAIVLYLLLEKRIQPFLALGSFALVAIHLYSTHSRSSLIACFFSLAPLIQLAGRTKYSRAYKTAFLALFLAAISVFIFLKQIPAIKTLSNRPEPSLFADRDRIWLEFAKAFLRNPLQGYGLHGLTIEDKTPHNIFLSQLVYFGFFGLVSFLMLLRSLGHRIYRNLLDSGNPLSRQILASLVVGALLQGLVEYIITYPLFFSNSMFWLICGFLLKSDFSDPREIDV